MLHRRALVLCPFALALAACGDGAESGSNELQITQFQRWWPWPTQETEQTYVVRDDDEWCTAWAAHRPQTTPPTLQPTVDFTANMVVGLTLGSAANGCYGVSIRRAVDDGRRIRVEYVYQRPIEPSRPDVIPPLCTQAIVALTDFVIIPKVQKAVYFVEVAARLN